MGTGFMGMGFMGMGRYLKLIVLAMLAAAPAQAADLSFDTGHNLAVASAANEASFSTVFLNFDDISKMPGPGATDQAGVYTPYSLAAAGGQGLKSYDDYFQFDTFKNYLDTRPASLYLANDLTSGPQKASAARQEEPLLDVPLPPSAILFGTALLGLVVLKKRKPATPS